MTDGVKRLRPWMMSAAYRMLGSVADDEVE